MTPTTSVPFSVLVVLALMTNTFARDIQRFPGRHDLAPGRSQISSRPSQVSIVDGRIPDTYEASRRENEAPRRQSQVIEVDSRPGKQPEFSARQDIDDFDDVDLYTVMATLMTSILLLFAVVYFVFDILIAPILNARSLSSLENWEFMLDSTLMERVLNSIDPVDSVFAFMKVDEDICKERTICELQRASSKFPMIKDSVEYASHFIYSLRNYKEAIRAGGDLEDCALLYSECPYSILL
ncbi:uncharacterized protein [Palaemon carinicauda]|uniref:uncharacterized protein n=1 Tax=Palaemon carinicauda TaxID=392227 RepID=UPI0035B69EB5